MMLCATWDERGERMIEDGTYPFTLVSCDFLVELRDTFSLFSLFVCCMGCGCALVSLMKKIRRRKHSSTHDTYFAFESL